MKKTIRIEGIETRQVGERLELAGSVRGLHDEKQRLWFRFPESLAAGVTPTADPFLAALLPSALACGRPLVVEGQVSWRLLEQTRQLMEVLSWLDPSWKPVPVEAGTWRGRLGSRLTGAFFSGGVDSFYTLLKNHDLEQGENRITHLLLVLGFDLESANEEMFAPVVGRLTRVAEQLGVQLLDIRTNMRDVTKRVVGWQGQQIGAGLAAVGLALGSMFRRILIASSEPMLVSLRLSTNPLLDPLWSTDSTEFVHDGCEATRLQRIRWRLAQSELALTHLRVCHLNHRRGSPRLWNCGRCDKCLRTMVLLETAGALERCSAFEGCSLDLDAVSRLRPDPRYGIHHLREAHAQLETEGRAPELQAALRVALRPDRYIAGRVWIHLRRSLRRLLGRRGLLLWRRWLLRGQANAASSGGME